METNENKLLDFDKNGYDKAIGDLQNMIPGVNYLKDCWTIQPLLQDMPFTREHYLGLLARGIAYIQTAIDAKVVDNFERQMRGLSKQMDLANLPKVIPVNIDPERLERTRNNLTTPPPGTRSARVNYKMIGIDKSGKPFISDETIEQLKKNFSLFGSKGDAITHVVELCQKTCEMLNEIQGIINKKHEARQAGLTYQLPHKANIFHVNRPGTAPEMGKYYGLMYQDGDKWHINYEEFRLNY